MYLWKCTVPLQKNDQRWVWWRNVWGYGLRNVYLVTPGEAKLRVNCGNAEVTGCQKKDVYDLYKLNIQEFVDWFFLFSFPFPFSVVFRLSLVSEYDNHDVYREFTNIIYFSFFCLFVCFSVLISILLRPLFLSLYQLLLFLSFLSLACSSDYLDSEEGQTMKKKKIDKGTSLY